MNVARNIGRSVLRKMGLRRALPVQGIWAEYSSDALQLAGAVDIGRADLADRQQRPELVRKNVSDRICNWYMPVFDTPSYGGIMTILRLANHLYEADGVRSRFLICGTCDPQLLKQKISGTFPNLSHSDVLELASTPAIREIPASDYSVATLWTTAYVLAGVKNTGLKFYMIQDYEPAFYPAGSTYAQAELTYDFGFYGICNTVSLTRSYEKDYGGKGVTLVPCIDTENFFPSATPRDAGPTRIFYYARPAIPRNGFELAVQAFIRLKSRLGAEVEIVCAGANWNPKDYGLAEIVSCVGLLPYGETGNLYRSCHIGLSMMMTRHPSYLPFELMGCGTLVVANQNKYNEWLLKDEENCLLAPPTVSCLSETLERAVLGYSELAPLREVAYRNIASHHSDWNASLARVASFMHDPEAKRMDTGAAVRGLGASQ